MSVTHSRPEDDSKKALHDSIHPAIDTNAILSSVVRQLPASVRNTMILRCDYLSQVRVPEKNLAAAFAGLLWLITFQNENKTLFLHVTAAEKKTSGETESVFVYFHTNLTSNEWLESDNQKVNNIAALLTPFGGSISINQLKNSGCIFAISLPGKQ